MSCLLGSIFGTLGNLFDSILSSWGSDIPSDDISSPSELHDDNQNNDDISDSDSSSDYDTAPLLLFDAIQQAEVFFVIESNQKAIKLNFLME